MAGRVSLQRLTKNTSTTSSTTSTRTFSGGIPIISSLMLLVRLVDRAMKREDSSEQGKIVTELMQHLHGCKNNCDVFFGRTQELERMRNYIVRKEKFTSVSLYLQVGDSYKPFVMYGAGGSGKSSMLSMTAYKAVNLWLPGSQPLLFVRSLGCCAFIHISTGFVAQHRTQHRSAHF